MKEESKGVSLEPLILAPTFLFSLSSFLWLLKSTTSQLGRGILSSRMGLQADIGMDLAPARERAGLF
jgi:hypothetical protein